MLGLMHLVPFVAVNIDLHHNSIAFYWNHLPLIVFLGLCYLGVNILQSLLVRGRTNEPIYPSHDYFNNVGLAFGVSFAMVLVLVAVFALLVWISNKKLASRFEGMCSLANK